MIFKIGLKPLNFTLKGTYPPSQFTLTEGNKPLINLNVKDLEAILEYQGLNMYASEPEKILALIKHHQYITYEESPQV